MEELYYALFLFINNKIKFILLFASIYYFNKDLIKLKNINNKY
jgi:hypothetical protein